MRHKLENATIELDGKVIGEDVTVILETSSRGKTLAEVSEELNDELVKIFNEVVVELKLDRFVEWLDKKLSKFLKSG